MPRKPQPWFRFWVESFSDRKLRRLTPAQRWAWAAILGAARQSPEPGVLYVAENMPMTVEELADFAGTKLADARKAVELAREMGMIAVTESGAFRVVNWEKRQPESDDVNARVRAHRARRSNEDETLQPRFTQRSNDVTETAVVTTPSRARATESDTESDTDTDTDTEEISTRSQRAQAREPDRFAEFWDAYPRRSAKGAAVKAFASAVRRVDADKLIDAARRYRDDPNRDPAFTAHASTWLNQGRWDDPPLPPRIGPREPAQSRQPERWVGWEFGMDR